MRDRRHRGPLTWRIHPIWRGIGLVLLIVIPFIAYGLAGMLMDYSVSHDLTNQNATQIVAGVDDLYLQIGLALVLTLLLYLVFSVVGSLLYSALGGRENEEIVSRIGSGRRR